MHVPASQIQGLPIISLQTGETVAWTRRPVIDLATLEVLGFHCETEHPKASLILMSGDIRQLAGDCIIIDNEDELAEPDDIVRLKTVLEAAFTPLEKPVASETGHKLGNVEDYTINLETHRIQKLHVRRSLLHAWIGATLTIDRTQIIDITPQQITVRDTTVKAPVMQTDPIPEPHP